MARMDPQISEQFSNFRKHSNSRTISNFGQIQNLDRCKHFGDRGKIVGTDVKFWRHM